MSDDGADCTFPQTIDSSDVPFKLRVTLFANQTTQELSIDMDGGEKFYELKVKISRASGLSMDHMRIFTSQEKMEERKPIWNSKKVVPSPAPLLVVYDPNDRDQDLFLSDEEEGHETFQAKAPEGHEEDHEAKFTVTVKMMNVFAGEDHEFFEVELNKGDTFGTLRKKLSKESGYDPHRLFCYLTDEKYEQDTWIWPRNEVKHTGNMIRCKLGPFIDEFVDSD